MNDELKPCPFCGGTPIVYGRDGTQRIAICNECNASTDFKETECEAIEAWNRRVQPTFTPAELEEKWLELIERKKKLSNNGRSND